MAVKTKFFRPVSDQVTTGWKVTPLFSKTNGTTAEPGEPAEKTGIEATTANKLCKVRFGPCAGETLAGAAAEEIWKPPAGSTVTAVKVKAFIASPGKKTLTLKGAGSLKGYSLFTEGEGPLWQKSTLGATERTQVSEALENVELEAESNATGGKIFEWYVEVQYEEEAVEKTHTVSASLSFASKLPRATTTSRPGSVSFKTVLARTTAMVRPGALAFKSTLSIPLVASIRRATLSFASTVGKVAERRQRGSLGFQSGRGAELPRETPFETGATLNMTVTRAQPANIAFKGTLARTVSIMVAAALSFRSSAQRTTTHLLHGTLEALTVLGRETSRPIRGALVFKTTLTHLETGAFIKFIQSTLGFQGTIAKSTGQQRTGALSFLSAQQRAIARQQRATLTPAGTLRRTSTRTITSTLSFASGLRRSISKGIRSIFQAIGDLSVFSGVPPQPTPTRATIFGNRSRVTIIANDSRAVLPPLYHTRLALQSNRTQATLEGGRSRVSIHG